MLPHLAAEGNCGRPPGDRSPAAVRCRAVGWLDSNGLRIVGYLAAAATAFLAGRRERQRISAQPYLWPTFWYATAVLFLVMAIGRAGNVAELAVDIGRRQAVAEGWYDDRRRYQAMAVASVAAVWFVVVLVALWRVPERRRRYLPMAIVSFTLVCFAGVRLVSLHQVDSLLYRRGISGVELGAIIEDALLVLAIAMTFWQPRRALAEGSSPPPPSLVGADRLPPSG